MNLPDSDPLWLLCETLAFTAWRGFEQGGFGLNPLTFKNGYRHNDRLERIVAIEYHHEGPGGVLIPFNVFTVDAEKPSEWISGLYDFDWCRRDSCLYYHCSGGGGRFYMHPLAFPKERPNSIWWDSSIVAPTNGGNCSNRKLSVRAVQRWGYEILKEPIAICGGGPNPFDVAKHDDVEYCSRCHDHLPTEELCGHIWWCEKCGDYSKPGERCEHRRTQHD